MKFEVTFEGLVLMHDGGSAAGERTPTPEELQIFLDAVMDEMLKLNEDATIGARGSDGHVEIEATVEAEEFDGAVAKGSSLIRSAIHAAGGYTPGWDIEWCEARASKVLEPA
jgi:hypothetical protein